MFYIPTLITDCSQVRILPGPPKFYLIQDTRRTIAELLEIKDQKTGQEVIPMKCSRCGKEIPADEIHSHQVQSLSEDYYIEAISREVDIKYIDPVNELSS